MNPIASQTTGQSDAAVTALQGASQAFHKKKPAPPPPNRDNAALQLTASPPHSVDAKSASFIAATLAASRNSSPTPKARTPGKMASSGRGDVVDSGSIAPTGSLISMFEQARAGDPIKRQSPRRSPIRTPTVSSESISEAPEPATELKPLGVKARPTKPKVKPKPRALTPPPGPVTRSVPEVLSPKPQRPSKPIMKAALRPLTPPTPPQPRGSRKVAAKPKQPAVTPSRSKPSLAALRTRDQPDQRPKTADTASSDDTFVSASSVQSPERPSLERPSPPVQLRHRRRLSSSMPPSPSREIRRHNPKAASVTSLPLESLADAIMASSLASTRLTPSNTGGSLQAPPLPRRQRSPRLMQTLRQPVKTSDEEPDRHKKGHLSKLHGKKKHAHHEGSRKRWREEITLRERKRYEAVWASNRGTWLEGPNATPRGEAASEEVLNVVVRQLWKRSRLPMDELAEVWDLVDRQGRGALGRQEFVVGMWLIDQRLRGRKIPAKVSDSVWGSTNGMGMLTAR